MDLLKYVDHTFLKADGTWEDIKKVAQESKEYGCASACIPPSYVKRAKDETGARITTVVGFPLGYQTMETKVSEARQAVKDGADEIDMVINISYFLSANNAYVEEEIRAVKEAIGSKTLKVIVETSYLSQEEKATIAILVERAGADYIKTSTGFAPEGAKIEDVKLFKEISPGLKIKAAGGISSIAEAKDLIETGARRLGSSSLVGLVKDEYK